MPIVQFSSGDVIADRRADYARMLDEGGDAVAAVELMEQALELVPNWAAGWFRLGEYREKSGQKGGAISAYAQAVELDADDVFGAVLKLALLGAADVPDQPPSRYVESLFDDYADRFETSLVKKLEYTVPGTLAGLITDVAGAGHRFRRVVDLGCGTGLFGVEISARTEVLEGFDLSANMLAKAEEKGIYHHLGQADLSLDADTSGLFAEGLTRHRADLVSAADVMMYLGVLDGVFGLVVDLLAPGGFFAFSVEDAGAQQEVKLAPSRRYAHSEAYVRRQLAVAGLDLLAMRRTVIRKDRGIPVSGILFVAQKAK